MLSKKNTKLNYLWSLTWNAQLENLVSETQNRPYLSFGLKPISQDGGLLCILILAKGNQLAG